MQPSDEDLISACRQGDPDAWAALVQRYQRLVYSIPRRSGMNEENAADVFQRVFTTLVEKLDSIEQPERIGAWLATTTRRETWRVSRRERVNVPLSSGDDDEPDEAERIVDDALLPDEVLLRLEEQHMVRGAVADLDERCRTLLTLLFYRAETPPYTEIAATLGTSEGSIGPTRARCLQKLRRLLEEAGVNKG